jgi:hypothetical protein
VTLRPLSSTFQRRYKSIKRDKIVPQIMVGAKPFLGLLNASGSAKTPRIRPGIRTVSAWSSVAPSPLLMCQIALSTIRAQHRRPPDRACYSIVIPTKVSCRFFFSFAPAKELAHAVEISLRCVCPRLWIPENLQRHSLVVPGALPGRTLTASSPAALAHTIPFLDACADYAHTLQFLLTQRACLLLSWEDTIKELRR